MALPKIRYNQQNYNPNETQYFQFSISNPQIGGHIKYINAKISSNWQLTNFIVVVTFSANGRLDGTGREFTNMTHLRWYSKWAIQWI
ncbi:MAG: hypothetical protein VSS75_031195 [Candidatus Parabeggiatoa sp.]|nr:hypothetical protein [Candidatus Parabeggiatoa sp.]